MSLLGIKFSALPANLILLSCLMCACTPNSTYIKVQPLDPKHWDPSSVASFTFQPLNAPANVKILWRTELDNQSQNFSLLVRTTTLRDKHYFLDTLNITTSNTFVDNKSGNLYDLSTLYCRSALFSTTDSTIQIDITPLQPLKGLNYIGIEVSNATFEQ